MGLLAISVEKSPWWASDAIGLSLVFPGDARPSLRDLRAAAPRSADLDAVRFTLDSGGGPEPWVELLAMGLGFEVLGVLPEASAPPCEPQHWFGLDQGFGLARAEWMTLRPGTHLAGAENLLPVVRAMVGAGAHLAEALGARGVVWRPARTAIGVAQFGRLVTAWLAGGPFPALGLTALRRGPDGSMRSEGLHFFTGQEFVLHSPPDCDAGRAGRIAVRLINDLIQRGAITGAEDLDGPGGERLSAEPADDPRTLNVRWRS